MLPGLNSIYYWQYTSVYETTKIEFTVQHYWVSSRVIHIFNGTKLECGKGPREEELHMIGVVVAGCDGGVSNFTFSFYIGPRSEL